MLYDKINMLKILLIFCGMFAVFTIFATPAGMNTDSVQKVHLIQDDAQDYMVSKVYPLKYVQANDIMPFVMGMTMRYNMLTNENRKSVKEKPL